MYALPTSAHAVCKYGKANDKTHKLYFSKSTGLQNNIELKQQQYKQSLPLRLQTHIL